MLMVDKCYIVLISFYWDDVNCHLAKEQKEQLPGIYKSGTGLCVLMRCVEYCYDWKLETGNETSFIALISNINGGVVSRKKFMC